MIEDLGGGPIKSIEHPHFWKAAILLALLVGGIWAWHHFKISRDIQAQQIQNQQFEAKQKTIDKGAILPH